MNLHSIKYILKSRLKVITSKENSQSIGNASTVRVTFENSLKIARIHFDNLFIRYDRQSYERLYQFSPLGL